jgi:hypothetical protein
MEVPISREDNGKQVVSRADIAGKRFSPIQGYGTTWMTFLWCFLLISQRLKSRRLSLKHAIISPVLYI